MAEGIVTDEASEEWVARQCERLWSCEMRRLAENDQVDYYAIRGDRIVAACQITCLSQSTRHYPVTWMSLRKWQILMMTSGAFNVKPLLIVRWTDRLAYMNISHYRLKLRLRRSGEPGRESDSVPVTEVEARLFHPMMEIDENGMVREVEGVAK